MRRLRCNNLFTEARNFTQSHTGVGIEWEFRSRSVQPKPVFPPFSYSQWILLMWYCGGFLKPCWKENSVWRWFLWELGQPGEPCGCPVLVNGSRGPVCEHLVTGLWVMEINILLESSEVLSGKEFCLILLLSFFWEASFRWSHFLSFPSGACSHWGCSEDWSLTAAASTSLSASLLMALCLV